MKKVFTIAAIAAGLIWGGNCFAQAASAKAGSGPNFLANVTTTIYDNDASNTPLLLRSDDYNGTGFATYTTVMNHNTVVIGSQIQSDGHWELDLNGQALRTVYITPNDAVGTQPPAPPAGFYYGNVNNVKSHCFDASGNVVPLANIVNGSDNCGLGLSFVSGGTTYVLVMSQNMPAAGPNPGRARVTCNTVSNGVCVSWTITPSTTAANPNVADLFAFTGPTKTQYRWTFIGQYYNTFRIDVTNP